MDGHNGYLFPQPLTSYMKQEYKQPAIYRWNVFREEPGDEKLIYIGEAQKLCPQRINNYLNPGPSQQTSKRINREFQNYLKKGMKIRLEILRFGDVEIGDFVIAKDEVQEKHVRRFIEELMVVIFRKKGYRVLNL